MEPSPVPSAPIAAPAARSFHLSPPRRFLVLSAAFFFIAVPAGIIASDPSLISTGLVVAALLAPFAGFFAVCAYYPRLTLDAEGVHLRGTLSFSRYDFPWSAVERLRAVPGSEGLVLREPFESRAARVYGNFAGTWINGVPLYDDEQRGLIASQRYVPLEPFGWWFDHGSLLSAFRDFAPSIAATFESDRKAAREAHKKDRVIILVVAGVTALVLIVSVAIALIEPEFPPATRAVFERVGSVVLSALYSVAAAALAVLAAANFVASLRFFRRRSFGSAVLWSLAALTQLLLAILLLSSL